MTATAEFDEIVLVNWVGFARFTALAKIGFDDIFAAWTDGNRSRSFFVPDVPPKAISRLVVKFFALAIEGVAPRGVADEQTEDHQEENSDYHNDGVHSVFLSSATKAFQPDALC